MTSFVSAEEEESERLEADDSNPAGSAAFVDVSATFRDRNLPNAMTVDVEDYFQVSAFEKKISRDDWDKWPQRLPRNIQRILQLFDDANVKATFFTLGWVCEKYPELVRDIVAQGHELASHSFDHARIWTRTQDEFFQDVVRTRKTLEDTAGCRVTGYRAPSFSIGEQSLWAHDVLQRAGYEYSSSIYPIQHDHYGLPDAPKYPFRTSAEGLLEIPLATITRMGRNWPCAGGGYFRLLPLAYSRWALRHINRAEQMPAVFYFHPWEIDAEQPRVDGIPLKSKFRHYVNLTRFEGRLQAMLRDFEWDRMDTIYLAS